MSTPMGSRDVFFFECGRCLSTYTGKPHELSKIGWVRHTFGRKHHRGDFLLCRECSAHLEPIWAKREAAKAAAKKAREAA